MPSQLTRRFVGCSCALLLFTCASDKARVADVTKFSLRECKRSGTTGELATGRETADYAGFDCVAWRVDGEHVDLDLINHVEMCGFQDETGTLWVPAVEQTAADVLWLSVSWEASPNACGSCLHDFSVSAKGLELTDGALQLNIETRSCKDECSWVRDAVNIPAAQSGEGIRCRYVDWTHGISQADTYVGKLGGPARDGACDDSLVATDVNGATRCLKACDSDDACSPPLTTCDTGVCKLSDPW